MFSQSKSRDPRTLLQRRLDGDPARVRTCSAEDSGTGEDCEMPQTVKFGCDSEGSSLHQPSRSSEA